MRNPEKLPTRGSTQAVLFFLADWRKGRQGRDVKVEPLQEIPFLFNNRGQRQSRVPCLIPLQAVGLWNDLQSRNRNELVASSMSSLLKPLHLRSSLPKDNRRPTMQQNAPNVPAASKVVHHAKDVDCCSSRTGRCQSETIVVSMNIFDLSSKIRFCNLVDTQCEKWKSESS